MALAAALLAGACGSEVLDRQGTASTSSGATSSGGGGSSSSSTPAASSSSSGGSGGTDPADACVPRTCADLGFDCGIADDGCGGTLECGTCPGMCGKCGGCGMPNVCCGDCCPLTCAEQGANCGEIGDGCSNVLDCGTCPAGEVCGATTPNVCSAVTSGSSSGAGGASSSSTGAGGADGGCVVQTTCAEQGAQCGFVPNGCGGVLDCGQCTGGFEACGAAGMPNVCGPLGDAPLTCAQQGFDCGLASDGVGGVIQCGMCPSGETCGAAVPNVCGAGTCVPETCPGFTCFPVPDGCGQSLDCRLTCASQGFECGLAGDGCGEVLHCGTCPPGGTCAKGKCVFISPPPP